NIIMQDADGRIIDCLRRVDISMSEERQILPGMFYRLPKTAGRVDFLNLSKEDVLSHISADELQEEKRLASIFMGFSPLVARELIFRAGNRKEALAEEITALAERIKAEDFAPIMLTKDDAPFDYSFMEIRQYGGAVHLERSESFSALLDGFYSERERKERQKKRAQELTRTVKAAQERLSRKLALQRDEFRQALDRENLKKYGDLIMAGLHTLNKGMQKARLTDYYEEGTPEIEIPLDVKLSPQQNAQKYYKNYNRMKNAEAALKLQTEQTERELLYLESVADELNRAQTQQELQEIREELLLSGYIKDKNQKKTGKKPRASGLGPHEYKTEDGFLVLAGRNNRQNEELTLKTALKTDIWFHTQKIPGSHVILLCGGKKPTDRAKSEAAMIAAFHSKASASALVPVDFTEVRFVKKLPGGKCGMVTYKNFETAIVTPDEKIIGRLKR
ncbi:MAG: NFACT family protein, partial [Bacillota bacterium]|nr:NFACT family protein [Bacillota bacterium]